MSWISWTPALAAACVGAVGAAACDGSGGGSGSSLSSGGGSQGAPARSTLATLCPDGAGRICTIAGTGIAGDGADRLPPLETRLYLPQDTTVGPDGFLYVVDWNNHRIRVIDDGGVMRIVAGAGELGPSADDPSTSHLNHPTSVAFVPAAAGAGPSDRLVIAAWHNSKVKAVTLGSDAEVDLCGTGKRGFGGNGGPAATATLDLPVAVVFDAAGDLLIADQANQMIRRVDRATDVISTIAGIGRCADAVNPDPCTLGDEGPAAAAGFHFPIGQAATPGGRIALGADGSIFVADTEHYRVRRIDPAGVIHTFAGTGRWGAGGDGGPATETDIGRVTDVAVAPDDGALFIADSDNSCVRVVSPAGTISTFAGRCGQSGFAGDGGPAAEALFDRPFGVEVSPAGDAVFVADTHNHRIRMIQRQGSGPPATPVDAQGSEEASE